MRSRRAISAATIVVATALLPACVAGGVCPAVAYSTPVTVTLDAAWPDPDELELEVECEADGSDEGGCDLTGAADGPRWDGMPMSPPTTVRVTVSRGGEVLSQEDVPLTVRTVDYPHGRGCPGLQVAKATIEPPS